MCDNSDQEYKAHVTYCCHLASIVCKLLDFNLLLWNYLANWNRTWYECSLNDFLQNLCWCFKGFKEGVSIWYSCIWILIIYCSFKKRGGQIGGVMVFNAIFNYISVISWLSCFIGGVCWENHRPATSLTNFIHNVSSNKGVLIAGIYIRTTVYINLKNTPPSKPQSQGLKNPLARRPGLVISTFGLAEIICCMPDGLVKKYIGYWQTCQYSCISLYSYMVYVV